MHDASGNEADGGADPPAGHRPLVVYDGDCGFCGYWARYWQRLTGDRIALATYQDVAAQYPKISLDEFRRAVQYIAPDGRVASAAEASFLALSHAPGKGYWLFLYRRVAGFAPASELAYRIIAAHRSTAYRVSLFLWGRDYEPPRYDLVSFAYLRLFGLIYLSAFVSFAVQALGLIGSHGILPLAAMVDDIAARVGPERFFFMPMLFWWNASDLAIQAVSWGGAALSLLLILDRLPGLALLLLDVLYLSLLYAGQDFMTYQWDTFLLEAGFLALVLRLATVPGIWLLRWLLFRFMFSSGAVKLASGDPTWWNLSALDYHFFTQPLPTPPAWYAAHLPVPLLKFATGSTLFIELALPLLIFCPRRLRFAAAAGILLLEVCISLTGNYNWFNLQTMLLCLPLFDDAALRRIWPRRAIPLPATMRPRPPAPRRSPTTPPLPMRILIGALALLIVLSSLAQMDMRFGGRLPDTIRTAERFIEPLHMVGAYGLFAVMTTQRDEIVIQGSDDGTTWRDYEFRYKPGDVARRPPWNIPHQPRLDWQMWFAALEDPRRLPWFQRFLQKILENDPAVTALLEANPFPDTPPKFVRAQFYEYTFTDRDAHARGIWWNRRLLGLYFPEAQLRARD